MDPEFELHRLRQVPRTDRFVEMVENVGAGDDFFIITDHGRPIAAVVSADGLALLRQLADLGRTEQSDERQSGS